jgi:Domain of unknown function (DUF4129)
VSRDYDEFLGRVFDLISPAWVALILLAVAVAGGFLWYTYPAWLRIRLPRLKWNLPRWTWPKWNWRWPRFKRPRFKRRARKKKQPKAVKPARPVAPPEPDPEPRPVPAALSAADRLAAEGRYAEAIRERLRESVTALTRYGVIAPAPAWTAHEVAVTASANRPAVSAPLAGATDIFSEVWYGRRPAGPDQDALMRRLTAEVRAVLETSR